LYFQRLFAGIVLNEIEVSSLIEQHFDTSWNARTPINWDNDNATPSGPHVAFTIDHSLSNRISMGNGGTETVLNEGLITVQVFTPQGTGTEQSRLLCDGVTQILSGFRKNSLHLKSAVRRKIGEDGNGFWQVNVDIPFEYMEVRSIPAPTE
jgi:hypothetical protein